MKTHQYNKNIPKGWKAKEVFNVSYKPLEEVLSNIENIRTFKTDEEIKEHMDILVYQEGNIDVDPVIDTGCPKTVCGKDFMDAFIASKGKHIHVERKYEDQKFKFGDGNVYNSSMSHAINVEIGDLKTTIQTSVVEANIPLLLGMDYLKKWGVVIDTGKEMIHIRKSKESFNIDSNKSNHWKLPIQNGRTLHKQAHRLVLHVEISEMNDHDLRKHIVKTHKNLAHKSEGHMTRLFLMAGKADRRTRKAIKEVCDSCTICKQFRKTRPRPTVALSKANTSKVQS